MKYDFLLNIKALKKRLVIEFIVSLSGRSIEEVTEVFQPDDQKYYQNGKALLGLDESEWALVNKFDSIVSYRDTDSAVRMLKSFSRGTKRLKSNYLRERDHERQYDWTDKDGNEKFSHKGNLPQAHFRWNYGNRYLLAGYSIKKIEQFLNERFTL